MLLLVPANRIIICTEVFSVISRAILHFGVRISAGHGQDESMSDPRSRKRQGGGSAQWRGAAADPGPVPDPGPGPKRGPRPKWRSAEYVVCKFYKCSSRILMSLSLHWTKLMLRIHLKGSLLNVLMAQNGNGFEMPIEAHWISAKTEQGHPMLS